MRAVYFDRIASGEKGTEVRAMKPYWLRTAASVAAELSGGRKVGAVFVCGKRVHRRELVGITVAPSARAALGREPSDLGMLDLGRGPVYVFSLGGKLPIATIPRGVLR